MIVVDTSVWIDWLHDRNTTELERLRPDLRPAEIIVGDIVLLEILQGARDEVHAAKLEARMRRFRCEPMLDARLAVKAAAHYRRLRSLGATVRKIPDLIIATFCIHHDHELLQNDRDFLPIAQHLGLRLI